MKKTLIASSLFVIACSASAVDGTIQFTGSFTNAPCTVSMGGNNTTAVSLDHWSVNNYNSVGQTTDLKPITIELTGCPANMKLANIRFTGNADSINSNLFAINSTGTPATNVGVGLYSSESTNNMITPNSRELSIPLSDSAGAATIYASYMLTGTVTEGTANADINFDISYQ